MCGRLNIVSDPLCQLVSKTLGIEFTTPSNDNLCPSQTVATVIKPPKGFQQLNTQWGIQPTWSKHLLINAQSETAAQKKTFQQSFNARRCLVPCTGWYEWRTEEGKKKKYSFTHSKNEPFYMAGIWYDNEVPQLVTLTAQPNEKCAQYHNRMPAIILPKYINYWFNSSAEQLQPVLNLVEGDLVKVERVE